MSRTVYSASSHKKDNPPGSYVETVMNGVRTRTMKIIKPYKFYEGSPPQDLSEAGRGSAVFTAIHFRN